MMSLFLNTKFETLNTKQMLKIKIPMLQTNVLNSCVCALKLELTRSIEVL